MSVIKERRERERAQRHRLIIMAARELAEAEGWEAVTTWRLAERVEYSQPVLYSHFSGKDAIVRAVAIDGFGELAAHLRRARTAAVSPGQPGRAPRLPHHPARRHTGPTPSRALERQSRATGRPVGIDKSRWGTQA